jgi:hypothetical protein
VAEFARTPARAQGGNRTSAAISAALISDIGEFNDRGFNQNQLQV